MDDEHIITATEVIKRQKDFEKDFEMAWFNYQNKLSSIIIKTALDNLLTEKKGN